MSILSELLIMPSSKSMLLRVLLCLEILLLVTAYEERRRYCGPILNAQLSLLCHKRGGYASHIYNGKRSGDSEDYPYMNDEALAEMSPFSYESMPFIANFGSATALHSRVRRNSWYSKRGVWDECCSKPCTREELQQYCS